MFDYIENILAQTHLREQALRLLRIFAFTAIPQLLLLGSDHLTRTAFIAIAVAAAETAFRQVYPASTWAAIHSVAAQTPTEIVPPAVQ
jgi:hypothetical protein